MLYKDLVSVYEKIDTTSKRLEKTSFCAQLLKKATEKDLPLLIPLLQGKIFPDWSEAKIGMASKMVIKALALSSGNAPEVIEQHWKKLGDLGLVAAKLMEKKKQATLFSSSLTIQKVHSNIIKVSNLDGPGSVDQKVKLTAELLGSSTPEEAKYIVRTVLEDLRVGIGDSSLRDAIAWAFLTLPHYQSESNTLQFKNEQEKADYQTTTEILQHACDVVNDYAAVAMIAKDKGKAGLEKLTLKPGNPIKVMLYPKAKDIEDAFSSLSTPVALEYKYDGFRMQIHKHDNTYTIYTRRLENVTKQFSELLPLLEKIKAKNFILDSEAVGYDKQSKKYLPFQYISQRIRRKYNIQEMAQQFPVELNIFDLLYVDNRTLLNAPFSERRKILEKIIPQEKNKITFATQLITSSLEEAKKFYDASLKAGNEGIMAKKLDAPYKPGSRVGYGMKIKPVMESLDLVITQAEYGTGKRAGWLTSFTVATEDDDGNLLEIGKVGTGFKEKEESREETGVSFEQLTNLLKPLVIKEQGKTIICKPQVIIEVSYEEIQKSSAYSSGYALRFPRILRLREDKSELSNLEYIHQLYEKQ